MNITYTIYQSTNTRLIDEFLSLQFLQSKIKVYITSTCSETLNQYRKKLNKQINKYGFKERNIWLYQATLHHRFIQSKSSSCHGLEALPHQYWFFTCKKDIFKVKACLQICNHLNLRVNSLLLFFYCYIIVTLNYNFLQLVILWLCLRFLLINMLEIRG